jgi:transcriptional regulator with XRE-family HTH domain
MMQIVATDEERIAQAEWDGLGDPERAAVLTAALRLQRVSQTDLMKMLDVSYTTINRWKQGHTPISWARWVAICGALKIPTGWRPPKPKVQ